MTILNIAGYKFIPLDDLDTLREQLYALSEAYFLKGTILLGLEGINLNLAGEKESLLAFIERFQEDERFNEINFHQTYSETIPFKRLKVKKKKEIITMKREEVDVLKQAAPTISPDLLRHWLDSRRDVLMLDVRNDYEVKMGTFTQATDLKISDFSEFPDAIDSLPRSKPIVMFCTGGIRCEKAAVFMLKKGFQEVYQLEGGILGYFAKQGGAHFQGDCFIFDERLSISPEMAHIQAS